MLTDGVVVNAGIRGDDDGVPILSVNDECVRRTCDLLLRLLGGKRVRGLIFGADNDFRGSGIFGEYRAAVLDRSSHDVVVKNVDAQVDLADGSLEVLSEVRTMEN